MNLQEAHKFLDQLPNYEKLSMHDREATAPPMPTLDRIRKLTDLMAEPQHQYPVIHVTGTNGKTSTSHMISNLLIANGLSVGTYTSPHLENVNERIRLNSEPIPDDALVDAIEAISLLTGFLDEPPSYFEVVTAAAFRWFADVAVDAAVIEVGLGGRWDATNVCEATVAVVTNVAIDHTEYLGSTRQEIASEKCGIVKEKSHLVLGEDDPEIVSIFRQAPSSQVWECGVDFACEDNLVAVGGRSLDVRTPAASYAELFVPLHGRHQGDNAACAMAAAEAFFDAPLSHEVVSKAFSTVAVTGRMEVLQRNPICILDGAHNPAGARAAADTLEEDFGVVNGHIFVIGLLDSRDPDEMLSEFASDRTRLVVACSAPTPRALPAVQIAEAAERLGLPTKVAGGVAEALAIGLSAATEDDLVLVTGSLYVVGAARAAVRSGSEERP